MAQPAGFATTGGIPLPPLGTRQMFTFPYADWPQYGTQDYENFHGVGPVRPSGSSAHVTRFANYDPAGWTEDHPYEHYSGQYNPNYIPRRTNQGNLMNQQVLQDFRDDFLVTDILSRGRTGQTEQFSAPAEVYWISNPPGFLGVLWQQVVSDPYISRTLVSGSVSNALAAQGTRGAYDFMRPFRQYLPGEYNTGDALGLPQGQPVNLGDLPITSALVLNKKATVAAEMRLKILEHTLEQFELLAQTWMNVRSDLTQSYNSSAAPSPAPGMGSWTADEAADLAAKIDRQTTRLARRVGIKVAEIAIAEAQSAGNKVTQSNALYGTPMQPLLVAIVELLAKSHGPAPRRKVKGGIPQALIDDFATAAGGTAKWKTAKDALNALRGLARSLVSLVNQHNRLCMSQAKVNAHSDVIIGPIPRHRVGRHRALNQQVLRHPPRSRAGIRRKMGIRQQFGVQRAGGGSPQYAHYGDLKYAQRPFRFPARRTPHGFGLLPQTGLPLPQSRPLPTGFGGIPVGQAPPGMQFAGLDLGAGRRGRPAPPPSLFAEDLPGAFPTEEQEAARPTLLPGGRARGTKGQQP